MDWKDLTHGILFFLEVTFIIVAVMKVVGKIETTTALLQQALQHLADAMDTLTAAVDKLDNRTNDHQGRLIKLETQMDETGRHKVAR